MKSFILDLTGLSGNARTIVSRQVQIALLEMGILWASGHNQPAHTEREALELFQRQDSSFAMRVSDLDDKKRAKFIVEDATIFDARNNVEGFLKAARTVETVILGVKVTLTPETVTLNAEDLLKQVEKIAHAQRHEAFGV